MKIFSQAERLDASGKLGDRKIPKLPSFPRVSPSDLVSKPANRKTALSAASYDKKWFV